MDLSGEAANAREVAPAAERENVLRPQMVDILKEFLRDADVSRNLQELFNRVDYLLSSNAPRFQIGLSPTQFLERFRADPAPIMMLLYRLRRPTQKEEVSDKAMVPVESREEEDQECSGTSSNSNIPIKREEFVEDSILDKAFWKMESCTEGPQIMIRLAGKQLFDHIFTEEEKADCFASKRGGQREFPYQKVQNLSRALRWLQNKPRIRTLDELNKAKVEYLEATQFYFFRLEVLINYANVVRNQLKNRVD